MAAAQWSYGHGLFVALRLLEPVGPNPGGVDNQRRINSKRLGIALGLNLKAADLSIGADYSCGFKVVQAPGAVVASLCDNPLHQASIIGYSVGKAAGARHFLGIEAGYLLQRFARSQKVTGLGTGDPVVNPKQNLKQSWPGELALKVRHDEAQRFYKPGRLSH